MKKGAMNMLVRIIAAAITIEGVFFLLKPDLIKRLLSFWKEGTKIYFGALIALTIGILFIFNSQTCAIPAVVLVFGFLSLLKGIALMFAQKAMLRLNDRIMNWTEARLRLISIFAIMIGMLLYVSS